MGKKRSMERRGSSIYKNKNPQKSKLGIMRMKDIRVSD